MTVLLDTHALLWWVLGDERLSMRARDLIADPDTIVLVSAVSMWEITTRYRIRKLPQAEELALNMLPTLRQQGFMTLPISPEHALRAGLMAGEHRDPFDRMLIAQSLETGAPLISNEELFDGFGVIRIW